MADDGLATNLQGCQNSYQRARVLEETLRSGGALVLDRASDRAGVARVSQILGDPPGVLSRVESYLATSFRRLYNQRNMIMHMGWLKSCVLDATLRSAPALVGAAMDRIAYGLLVTRTPALALAARAENELRLLGTNDGRWLVDLLA